jgi:hypothetical protein
MWLPINNLASRVFGLASGERLTVIGLDQDQIGGLLRAAAPSGRSALLLDTSATAGADTLLDRLLDDLAELALESWPRWYEAPPAGPFVSAPWVRAAAKLAATGRPPRFRRAARAFEFAQLTHAVDAAAPVFVASVDSAAPSRAASVIQVLEWCAGQGASIVVALASRPPPVPPYDRVLYGALELVAPVEPARSRFIPAHSRAHHGSAIEQRIEAALQRDPELAPLFSCNETIAIGPLGLMPRVDLLWREGRVVVELDGPEHQNDPNFANDRHRDYELLVAGYLVLRITNHQVETDLQRAIEKIRAVVHFRRSIEGVPS